MWIRIAFACGQAVTVNQDNSDKRKRFFTIVKYVQVYIKKLPNNEWQHTHRYSIKIKMRPEF